MDADCTETFMRSSTSKALPLTTLTRTPGQDVDQLGNVSRISARISSSSMSPRMTMVWFVRCEHWAISQSSEHKNKVRSVQPKITMWSLRTTRPRVSRHHRSVFRTYSTWAGKERFNVAST